jgi:hypothetical protein
MGAIMKFFGGMFIIAIGLTLVIKTEWYLQNFGRVDWAEQHLGFEGGSRLFYKLLGTFVCFIGILVAFDLFGGFFRSTVGQLILPPNAR